MPDKVKMGELHVQFLAQLIGGRITPGSGNQWKDPIDARADRTSVPFAFAAEGKSTLGESIAFSRPVISKAREQAGGERPLIGLRFYGNERLDKIDEEWVAVLAQDFAELLEQVNYPLFIIKPSEDYNLTQAELDEFRQIFESMLANGVQAIRPETPSGDASDEISMLREAVIRLEQELEEFRQSEDAPLIEQLTRARMKVAELERRPSIDQAREMFNQIAHLTVERDEARRQAQAAGETLAVAIPGVTPEQGKLAEAESRADLAEAEARRLAADVDFKTRIIGQLRNQLAGSQAGAPDPRSTLQAAMSQPPPVLPWMVIFQTHMDGRSQHTAIAYDAAGNMSPMPIVSVKVEPTPDGGERIMVNDRQLRAGELYIDGQLIARTVPPQ